jgi:hypothetical protein
LQQIHRACDAACVFYVGCRGLMISLWIAANAEELLGVTCDRFAYQFLWVNGDRGVLAVEELGETDELLPAV